MIIYFLCRDEVSSAKPKLLKKLVKAKRFWKINAIRPEIKAKRGRTRKFNLWAKSKLGRIGEGVRFLNRNPKTGL